MKMSLLHQSLLFLLSFLSAFLVFYLRRLSLRTRGLYIPERPPHAHTPYIQNTHTVLIFFASENTVSRVDLCSGSLPQTAIQYAVS